MIASIAAGALRVPSGKGAPRAITISRSAFTLVELLVSITIIAILAGIMLGALQLAKESAREAKTKATITKINRAVMSHYEPYITRKVKLNILPDPPTRPAHPKQVAQLRLGVLRRMMCLEMPERWGDVTTPLIPASVDNSTLPQATDAYRILAPVMDVDGNGTPDPSLSEGKFVDIGRPALSQAYVRRFTEALDRLQKPPRNLTMAEAKDRVFKHGSAECLYLFVTLSSGEGRADFKDSEVADTDDDGLWEFVDGWGNPIYFLRWAPGFLDSDLQPQVPYTVAETDTSRPSWDKFDPEQTKWQAVVREDHDPFDPLWVDGAAWRLVPLIYSAGPDGEYGIEREALDSNGWPASVWNSGSWNGGKYWTVWNGDTFDTGWGRPADDPDGDARFDNIHNHRFQARER